MNLKQDWLTNPKQKSILNIRLQIEERNCMEEYSTGRKVWGVIYPVLLYTMIQVVVDFLVAVVMGVWYLLENGHWENGEFQQSFYKYLSEQSILMLFVATLVSIPVFYFLYRRDSKQKLFTYGLARVKKLSYLWIIPASIAAYFLFTQLLDVTIVYLPEASLKSFAEADRLLTSGNLILQTLTVVVMAPVVEELLFRGLVFRRLSVLLGTAGGIFGSALIFAVFHGNLIQGIYAFLVGILLAWTYYHYRAIYAPILMHMCMNGVSQVLRFIDVETFIYSSSVVFFVVVAVEMILFLICCFGISRLKAAGK